jgi:hypothetical protein
LLAVALVLQTYGEVIGMRHDNRLRAALAPDRLRAALRSPRSWSSSTSRRVIFCTSDKRRLVLLENRLNPATRIVGTRRRLELTSFAVVPVRAQPVLAAAAVWVGACRVGCIE